MATGRHRRARNGAALLAALLAVFLQALVVQTHVDGLGGLIGSPRIEAGNGHAAAPPQTISTPNTKADIACPICQAAAAAGRALIATRATLATPPHTSQTDVVTHATDVVVRPSYAWRSRAPPTSL